MAKTLKTEKSRKRSGGRAVERVVEAATPPPAPETDAEAKKQIEATIKDNLSALRDLAKL